MSVNVRIPAPLRRLTDGQDKVNVDGDTVNEAVSSLDQKYPGIRERLCDESGELRNFVNLYVNGEDIRFLEGLSTPIESGDELSVVPAVAGGQDPD